MDIQDLGIQPFDKVWELQKELVQERAKGQIANRLLLVEHPLVFTTGRAFKPEHLLDPGDIPVMALERGGDITFHEPGQLVGYPIVALKEGQRDIKQFLNTLENLLIATLKHFGIAARSTEDTGVWVGDKKIASIGISVRRWVTYHGFALNVSNPLQHVKLIKPCGFLPETMTSMQKITQTSCQIHTVKETLKTLAPQFLEAYESAL